MQFLLTPHLKGQTVSVRETPDFPHVFFHLQRTARARYSVSMNNIGLFIMLVAVGAIASHCAQKRGRNPRAWFILGFVFGLIGLAILFILPSRKTKRRLNAPTPTTTPQINKPAIEALDPSHADKLWYYLDEGHQQYGPMSINALSRAWEEGKIKPQTFVWNEQLTEWKAFDQVLLPNLRKN